MDPMTLSLLMMSAGQNPEAAGPLLDSIGLPLPPGWSPAPANIGASLGGGSAPAGPATATPAAATGGNSLSALQGVKAPAPVTPIMSGGVSGGVKAPEQQLAGLKGGSPAIQMLMQALLQRNSQPAVPTLGELVRNVRP